MYMKMDICAESYPIHLFVLVALNDPNFDTSSPLYWSEIGNLGLFLSAYMMVSALDTRR